MTKLNPYLNFRDTARDAMEFYRSVFGGELTFTTFGDFGVSDDPAESTKIMHAQLVTEGDLTLMAADVPNRMELSSGTNYSVSISGDDLPEATLYWDRLAHGATITAPFAQAPWGDTFGMLVDRFGVSWLFNVAGPS